MVGYSVLIKASFLIVYTADIIYVKDVRECDTNHCRMHILTMKQSSRVDDFKFLNKIISIPDSKPFCLIAIRICKININLLKIDAISQFLFAILGVCLRLMSRRNVVGLVTGREQSVTTGTDAKVQELGVKSTTIFVSFLLHNHPHPHTDKNASISDKVSQRLFCLQLHLIERLTRSQKCPTKNETTSLMMSKTTISRQRRRIRTRQ